jgi:predicted  nucleic acid-binding Zn-ribbon protein
MSKRIVFLMLAAILTLAGAQALAQSTDPPDTGRVLESTRAVLAEWVATQQVISKEKKDWRVGKELLEQRIDLIQGEIRSVEQKISETRSSITEADEKRRDLVDENEALKVAAASLVSEIAVLEGKTRTLLERLPDPVRERVNPLARRLPADPANTDQSLGERYQNVIGILNEVNKFNREITVASELRTMPDGTTAEVQALYVGVSLGYYVTPNGDAAGVGEPTAEGWKWTPADELAGEITRAIAILNNEDIPAYVPLPVKVQ